VVFSTLGFSLLWFQLLGYSVDFLGACNSETGIESKLGLEELLRISGRYSGLLGEFDSVLLLCFTYVRTRYYFYALLYLSWSLLLFVIPFNGFLFFY